MKTDFESGSSSIETFFYWMNERHSIYVKRFEKQMPQPWTDDPILQEYKFTNVFRQLDRGTIALQKMVHEKCQEYSRTKDQRLGELIIFNIIWYRLYNFDVHATGLGWVDNPRVVKEYTHDLAAKDEKVFTGAHMTASLSGESKVESYTDAVNRAFDRLSILFEECLDSSIEKIYYKLLSFHLIGGFTAYEIACDLRFTPLLDQATDKLTWANIGPGSDRGMKRLGYPSSVSSMVDLYHLGFKHLSHDILNAKVPYELREIEHSLCEFDKYERARLGQGKPRSKFKLSK